MLLSNLSSQHLDYLPIELRSIGTILTDKYKDIIEIKITTAHVMCQTGVSDYVSDIGVDAGTLEKTNLGKVACNL